MDRWTGPKRSDVHLPMCEVEQVATHLLSAGGSSYGQTGGKSTTSCPHGKSKSQIPSRVSESRIGYTVVPSPDLSSMPLKRAVPSLSQQKGASPLTLHSPLSCITFLQPAHPLQWAVCPKGRTPSPLDLTDPAPLRAYCRRGWGLAVRA